MLNKCQFASGRHFVLARWLAAAALLLLPLAGGCDNGGGGARLPVTGKVSFHGRPLPFGTIEFQSSKAVGGGPIKDGAFDVPAEHGVPPGIYRVTISAIRSPAVTPGPPGPEAKDAGEEIIPPEFNDNSDRTVEVKRGEPNQFNFDIP